jgi:hypothetical protein
MFRRNLLERGGVADTKLVHENVGSAAGLLERHLRLFSRNTPAPQSATMSCTPLP